MVYGVRAEVKIVFAGNILELSQLIRERLYLSEFEISNSESPPFEMVATTESLGCSVWLKCIGENKFSFEVETEDSLMEIAEGRMYDLTPWLSRYLQNICELEVELS